MVSTLSNRPQNLTAKPNDDISALTLDQLTTAFENLLGDVAAHIVRLGCMWKRLEELGGDMDRLRRRGGLIVYVALVGNDDMIPEAVVKFAGQIEHLRVLALMPPDRQRAICDGTERIPFFIRNGGGDSLSTAFEDIRREHLSQVFDRTRRCFRDLAEQRLLVEAPPPPGKPVRRANVSVNRAKKLVKIGNAQAPLSIVLDAFRAAGYEISGA